MVDDERLERVNRWGRAYNAMMKSDTPSNRATYLGAYQEAYRRKECMLCGRPMGRPQLHRELDPDDQTPIGPDFLAHPACLHKQVRESGFDPGPTEPIGVEEGGGGTIVSNTYFDRREGPDAVVIEKDRGGYVGVCRVCDLITRPRATADHALEDVRAHVKGVHGRDIKGDWTR